MLTARRVILCLPVEPPVTVAAWSKACSGMPDGMARGSFTTSLAAIRTTPCYACRLFTQSWKVKGMIVHVSRELMQEVTKWGVPCVNTASSLDLPHIPTVRQDNVAVGRNGWGILTWAKATRISLLLGCLATIIPETSNWAWRIASKSMGVPVPVSSPFPGIL